MQRSAFKSTANEFLSPDGTESFSPALPTIRKLSRNGLVAAKHYRCMITLLQSARGDSMTNMGGVVRLLKKEHDRLSKEIEAVGAALIAFGVAYAKGTTRRGTMSAAGRARIAAAQRARWARVKAESGNPSVVTSTKKRSMSASARKRIAAAQRARWAKVKAAKRKS